jgi:hypothetical protein
MARLVCSSRVASQTPIFVVQYFDLAPLILQDCFSETLEPRAVPKHLVCNDKIDANSNRGDSS